MMNYNTTESVGYVRVSHEKQVDNYSLDTQTELIKKFANGNNMTLVKCFREEGCSGRNTNRPQYQAMMKYIRENEIKVVIVHKLDRLHRDEYNAMNDIKFFRANGIKLITIAEGLDSDEPLSTLGFMVHFILAADFSRNLASETRKGLLAGAKCCKHLGGTPPYGFQVNRDTGLLEIDETTAPAVRGIFELYAEGFTTGEICEWLEAHGYRTAKGNSFKANSLNAILHNEKYRGCYVWDKASPKDSEGHRNSHKHKESYIKIEGGCPAIVTQELFEKAQERLKYNSNKANRNKAKRYYPLNGYIYCECGARMTGNVQYSKSKKYYQYRCSAKCGNKPIRAEYLENAVISTIKKCLFSSTNTSQILECMNVTVKDKQKDLDSEYQQLTSKKYGLITAQDNLLRAIETDKGTTAIMKRLDRISNELEGVTARLESFDRDVHVFAESDLLILEKRFVPFVVAKNSVNNKRFLNDVLKRVQVNSDTICVELSNSINIDKNIKNYLKGETNMKNIKTRKLDAILLNLKGNPDGSFSLIMAVRPPHAYGYSGSCQLSMTYEDLNAIAVEEDCDFDSLVGTHFHLNVEMKGADVNGIIGLIRLF